MDVSGNGFTVRSDYVNSINNLFKDVGGLAAIKSTVPQEVFAKAINHFDVNVFVANGDLIGGIDLPGIVGPYKVYTEDMIHLCTVKLHKGVFGTTFEEIAYFSKLPLWSILYVSYIDIDSTMRNIQIIKKD